MSEEIQQFGPLFMERINNSFEDSMVFVGRILGGHPEATAARVVGVDGAGLDLVLTDPTDEHFVRVLLDEPVTTIEELTAASLALVTKARLASGEEGTTSAERELAQQQAYRTFLAEVVAVEDVHPHLRRITFGKGQLDELWIPGPDTFLYVLIPTEGRDELVLDEAFTFDQWMAAPEDRRPFGAYYTVRRWHPDRCELEMLFVLHGDEGALGAWGARAQVGDRATLWGPRVSFEPPAGTDRYLLVADETGLPGVAAIIDSLPPGTPVTVVAEVADETSRQELPARPEVQVTWLHRDGAEAGTTTELLADAVRGLPAPAPTTYAWGGGESRSMTAVRKHLRHEVGLERDQVNLVAYWRHKSHEQDPITDDED